MIFSEIHMPNTKRILCVLFLFIIICGVNSQYHKYDIAFSSEEDFILESINLLTSSINGADIQSGDQSYISAFKDNKLQRLHYDMITNCHDKNMHDHIYQFIVGKIPFSSISVPPVDCAWSKIVIETNKYNLFVTVFAPTENIRTRVMEHIVNLFAPMTVTNIFTGKYGVHNSMVLINNIDCGDREYFIKNLRYGWKDAVEYGDYVADLNAYLKCKDGIIDYIYAWNAIKSCFLDLVHLF